jgi:hypothetical protein
VYRYIVRGLNTFHIRHMPRKENSEANALVQQVLWLEIRRGMFFVKRRMTLPDVLVLGGKSSEGCSSYNDGQEEKRPTSSWALDEELIMDIKMTGSVDIGERPTRWENNYQERKDVSVTNNGVDWRHALIVYLQDPSST